MPNVLLDVYGGRCPNPGGQQAFIEDWTHRYIALEGGWGSGKTYAGGGKLLTLHWYNAFDDQDRLTGVKSAIIAPTYQSALDYDVPEILAAAEEACIEIIWVPSHMQFIIPCLSTKTKPSLILVRTAEKPGRIAGWQVGAAWGDEPARWQEDYYNPLRDPYIQLTGRVRDPKARFRQLMFTYSNEGDATRIFAEFHKGLDSHALYRAKTSENPAVAEFEAEQRLLLSKDLAEQYLDGGALSLRGALAYAAFDRKLHVNKDLKLDSALPLQLTVDFNIRPGMHGEIGQYNEGQDRFIVTDEIFGPRMDIRGLVQALGRFLASHKEKFPELEVFGDSATGHSGTSQSTQTHYEMLRSGLNDLPIKHRMRVPNQNPRVLDRLNAMEVAMLDIQGNVHWQCHPRCERLIEDLQKLRRGDDGQPIKTEMTMSHASDAEGYRVHYLRPARIRIERKVGGRISVV